MSTMNAKPTTDLVKVSAAELADQGERQAALQRLTAEAEAVTDPAVAREIMVKARAIGDLLTAMKASKAEVWLAGKASVVAARRLGGMLGELPSRGHPLVRTGSGARGSARGSTKSERTRVATDLGLSRPTCVALVRLGRIDDPSFQRYIQDAERIPSVSGALVSGTGSGTHGSGSGGRGWRHARRRRANVKTPAHPSLDVAHSEIVLALGHLGGVAVGGGVSRARAISRVMDLLYDAEDLLRPYTSGYGETAKDAKNRKALR